MEEKKELDKDFEKAIREFSKKLIENQEPLEPEFEKVLNEHFWDLLA